MGMPNPEEMTIEDVVKRADVAAKRLNEAARELYETPYIELTLEQQVIVKDYLTQPKKPGA